MMKFKILLIFCLYSFCNLRAQNESQDSVNFFRNSKKNNLKITQTVEIEKLSSIYFEQTTKNIKVFKIQLNTLNNSRQVAKNDSIKFENIFYPEKIEIAYEAPYFKSKTNYYLQEIEAEKKLKEIKKYFKNAFILQEKIDIKEINQRVN